MRHLVVIASLLLLPVPAMAQTAPAPTLSETVPVPRDLTTDGISGGRMLAISVGAVGGVIVANALTGGFVTPVLLAGAETGMNGVIANGAVEAAAIGWGVAQVAVSAVGAVVGGYVGNWVYGK